MKKELSHRESQLRMTEKIKSAPLRRVLLIQLYDRFRRSNINRRKNKAAAKVRREQRKTK